MAGTAEAAVARERTTRRHAWLLLALVLLVLESSSRNLLRFDAAFYSGLFTAVLVAGMYSAGVGRRMLITALVLGLPTVGLQWASYYSDSTVIEVLMLASASLFLLYTSVAILRQVLSASEVTADTIIGGIVVYVLLGILFLVLYSLAELLQPGSFRGAGELIVESGRAESFLIYFSFVTLTTLGYGDVSPIGSLARTLAMFEAVIGQLYLTILIAWLVGVRLTQYKSRD